MPLVLLLIVGGLAVAGTLAAIAFGLGVPLPVGLQIVIGIFAIGGPVSGVVAWAVERRRRRLAARGLHPCVSCGQPVDRRARRCAECGAAQRGVDALGHAITRARLGVDEHQPCPECGKAVRFDRMTEATDVAPGQHRCTRCGAIRHD